MTGSAAVLASFDVHDFSQQLFSTAYVGPALTTLMVATLAQLGGIVLGFFIAVARTSRLPPLRWLSAVYIWLWRGTPVLVQLIFVFDGTAELTNNSSLLTPINQSAVIAGIVALALNEAAYMAEIIRAGLLSVDRGQIEAARSLGMTPAGAMRRIILPQALRVIVPPTGNEYISMLKTTSLLAVIAVEELFHRAEDNFSVNLTYFESLAVICLWYLTFTSVATLIQSRIEKNLNVGYMEAAMPRQVGSMRRLLAGSGLARGAR